MWGHGFPGGLVVRIPGFHHHGLSSTSSKGTEIHGQKRKEKKKIQCIYIEKSGFSQNPIQQSILEQVIQKRKK